MVNKSQVMTKIHLRHSTDVPYQLELQLKQLRLVLICKIISVICNIFRLILYITPAVCSVTMHGLRAEDRLYQRSPGAQSDSTWRHVPKGGAGGEQEELPEKSSSSGGSGGVAEGEII